MSIFATPLAEAFTTGSSRARRTKIGLATATAGAAVVYAVSRLIASRNSEVRQYRRRMEAWLETRLATLSEALGTTSVTFEAISKEVHSAARATMCLSHKARTVKPEISDLLEIALDKRLTKMRMKIHKLLDIREAAQTEALHQFYEELRTWIIRPIKV